MKSAHYKAKLSAEIQIGKGIEPRYGKYFGVKTIFPNYYSPSDLSENLLGQKHEQGTQGAAKLG